MALPGCHPARPLAWWPINSSMTRAGMPASSRQGEAVDTATGHIGLRCILLDTPAVNGPNHHRGRGVGRPQGTGIILLG
jgi:hypothetical protein